MFLSECKTFEDYKIVKVPIVQVSGIESLYYATLYDRHYIKDFILKNSSKKLNNVSLKFM
jgi:hypothetical protein